MTELINKVKLLPDGVRGNVFSYIPRHDVATAVKEAIQNKCLKLKYVRSRQFPKRGSKALPNGWNLAWPHDAEPPYHISTLSTNNIIVWHLKELRPTSLISDTYGNGIIKRTNISVGERVRLQAIKKGLLTFYHDSRYNTRHIWNRI